jgi:protein gp37
MQDMPLNEQRAPAGIEWTRIKNADGTTRRGFTWNPIAGCLHDCEWVMPNGQRAECYAKTVAEKFTSAYPSGFAHYYWHPNRLIEPERLTEGAGIFPDSMSDLFGNWVQREHLFAVLNVMEDTPQHIYQCLTKNAPGYNKYRVELPANLWAGVSSPPDHMLGTDLAQHQKERYLHRALGILSDLHDERGITTWMSFEPLSQDWTEIVREYPHALKWAVIGAASNGKTYYPPEESHVRSLIEVLDDRGVAVFFKGNLRSLKWAAQNWREDFPVTLRSH